MKKFNDLFAHADWFSDSFIPIVKDASENNVNLTQVADFKKFLSSNITRPNYKEAVEYIKGMKDPQVYKMLVDAQQFGNIRIAAKKKFPPKKFWNVPEDTDAMAEDFSDEKNILAEQEKVLPNVEIEVIINPETPKEVDIFSRVLCIETGDEGFVIDIDTTKDGDDNVLVLWDAKQGEAGVEEETMTPALKSTLTPMEYEIDEDKQEELANIREEYLEQKEGHSEGIENDIRQAYLYTFGQDPDTTLKIKEPEEEEPVDVVTPEEEEGPKTSTVPISKVDVNTIGLGSWVSQNKSQMDAKYNEAGKVTNVQNDQREVTYLNGEKIWFHQDDVSKLNDTDSKKLETEWLRVFNKPVMDARVQKMASDLINSGAIYSIGELARILKFNYVDDYYHFKTAIMELYNRGLVNKRFKFSYKAPRQKKYSSMQIEKISSYDLEVGREYAKNLINTETGEILLKRGSLLDVDCLERIMFNIAVEGLNIGFADGKTLKHVRAAYLKKL